MPHCSRVIGILGERNRVSLTDYLNLICFQTRVAVVTGLWLNKFADYWS